jgi:hypothetical protein
MVGGAALPSNGALTAEGSTPAAVSTSSLARCFGSSQERLGKNKDWERGERKALAPVEGQVYS